MHPSNAALPLCLITLLAVVAPTPASAHVGARIEALDVLLTPGDTTALGIEASFGLVLADDGHQFDWTCHEVITAEGSLVTPAYARNANGVLLGGLLSAADGRDEGEALYRSVDGCDWEAPTGLSGAAVSVVAFSPVEPDLALAGTSTLEPLHNGVHRSLDAGRTWTPTPLQVDGVVLSLRFSDALPGVAWATTMTFQPLAHRVHRTDDGGASWEEHPVELGAAEGTPTSLEVLAVSRTDPLRAWLAAGVVGDRTLLHTEDGGATLSRVLDVDVSLIDGAVLPDGRVFATTRGAGTYGSGDGTSWEALGLAEPRPVGLAADARGLLLVPRTFPGGPALGLWDGDAGVEELHTFQDLAGPRECPAESDAARVCAPLWPNLEKALAPRPAPVAPPAPPTSCEAGGSSPAQLALLWPLLLLLRRRPDLALALAVPPREPRAARLGPAAVVVGIGRDGEDQRGLSHPAAFGAGGVPGAARGPAEDLAGLPRGHDQLAGERVRQGHLDGPTATQLHVPLPPGGDRQVPAGVVVEPDADLDAHPRVPGPHRDGVGGVGAVPRLTALRGSAGGTRCQEGGEREGDDDGGDAHGLATMHEPDLRTGRRSYTPLVSSRALLAVVLVVLAGCRAAPLSGEDIFSIPAAQIGQTQVLQTVVAGVQVFRSPDL